MKASVLPLVKNNPDIMDKAQEIHRIIRKRYDTRNVVIVVQLCIHHS